MNPSTATAAALTLAALTPAAAAQASRPMTAHDLWAMKRVAAPVLSPDGRTVAFVVEEWSVEKNAANSNVWLVPMVGGEPRRLTTAEAKDSAPTWSPDGKRIAFVSKRGKDETNALYVIPVDGGEAVMILEMPFALVSPRWLPDGEHIVVGTQVLPDVAGALGPADREAMKKEWKRRQASKMTAKVTEDRQFRFFDAYLTDGLASRLLRVHEPTGAVRDLTPESDRWFQPDGQVSYDVSPDGQRLVVVRNSTRPSYREFPNADLYAVPTDGSGGMKNLTAENEGFDTQPVFAPDGRSLYFLRTTTSYHNGESARLWRHDFESGTNSPLTESLDYSIAHVRVSPDGGTLWLLAEENGMVPVFRMNADGSEFSRVHAGGSASALDVRGESVVFLHSALHQPEELVAFDAAAAAARPLTRFNADLLGQLDLGRTESFWFEGAGGARVHGWIVFPPGFDPLNSYPLVQVMHGGPHTMSRDAWSYRWNSHVFAAPGCVVAHVNRHGSTGFGEAFAQSIVNAWGDRPFEDVMKATDHLLAAYPNLDSKRMAATGASYGGYLATWVLGHTDRFACIINHAGVSNSYSQFGTDVPHGFAKVMGGTPWDDVDAMQRQNPMFYARHFKSPTLIIHGELDYRVPYGQGLELYGVLQAMGVPSRLVIYPNENHWILTPQNSIRWYWEFNHWLARHLGLPLPDQPAFPDADD